MIIVFMIDTLKLLAQPVVNITTHEEAIYQKPFTMKCKASLEPSAAFHLIQYLIMEWVRDDGQAISQEIIGPQQNFSSYVHQSLNFNQLSLSNAGNYTCEAKLMLPNELFITSVQHGLNVLSE